MCATAWAGLRQNLDLRPGQTVLIRGATSALGQAAVNVAADLEGHRDRDDPRAKVFGFEDIVEAHTVMETGLAGGKMTVSVA